METYQEPVLRYRILRHEELPESHKAYYRERGINPDDNWSLVYSFYNEDAALDCLADLREEAASFQTYKMVDAGESGFITRCIY